MKTVKNPICSFAILHMGKFLYIFNASFIFGAQVGQINVTWLMTG